MPELRFDTAEGNIKKLVGVEVNENFIQMTYRMDY